MLFQLYECGIFGCMTIALENGVEYRDLAIDYNYWLSCDSHTIQFCTDNSMPHKILP